MLWDALNARSPTSSDVKALARKVSQSHAHSARKHQIYVRDAVHKLFKNTPQDAKLCFVKEEVFGVTDGGPIVGPDHLVMVIIMEQPIISVYFHIIIQASFCC
jgi:hypothetical protein